MQLLPQLRVSASLGLSRGRPAQSEQAKVTGSRPLDNANIVDYCPTPSLALHNM